MDTGNGSKATFADAVGKPALKPPISKLASPIELLNPDRYEFYTFDDSGDLVKRLMTMEEIRAIIATSGDDVFNIDNLSDIMPEKRVNDIVSNVQNVLKEEMESHKLPDTNQLFDTPDVSDSWSMILPAIFGNSGADIKPEKPATVSEPETVFIEPQTETTIKRTTTEKIATTSKANQVTRFTDYFLNGIRTNAPKLSSISVTSTKLVSPSSSTTQRSSTDKFYTFKPTKQEISFNHNKATTDSTTLKVQIFPNSNTNHLEEPYIKSSTKESVEYVKIRTPKPDLPLESRISSTILAHTPALSTSGPTTAGTILTSTTIQTRSSEHELSPSNISSTPKSTRSTVETLEFPQISTHGFEDNSSTITRPNLRRTTTSTTSEHSVSTPASQERITGSLNPSPTEKIYILLRPISSSTSSIKYEPVSFATEKFNSSLSSTTESAPKVTNVNPSSTTSTQSIFTTILQKPIINSIPTSIQTKVPQEDITSSTKIESASQSTISTRNTEASSLEQQSANYYTPHNLTKQSPTSTSPIPALTYKSTNLPTLSELLNNNPHPLDTSNTSTEYLILPTTYRKPEENTLYQTSSTKSEFQNLGSISGNKYTSSKTQETEIPTGYTTESITEGIAEETAKTTDDESYVTSTDNIPNKGLFNKLLLSSTNVYEINSAINQRFTVPSTTVSEEISTEAGKIEDEIGNSTLLESFGQLLAQAVGDINEIIVRDNITNTEATTEFLITNPAIKSETSEASTYIPESTTKFSVEERVKTTYTEYPTTSVTEENNIPLLNKFNDESEAHIINVTILRKQNSTKPAKADLSLEVDYDTFSMNQTEMQKLQTTLSEFTTVPSDLRNPTTPQIMESTIFDAKKSESITDSNYYISTSADEVTVTDEDFTTGVTQNVSSTIYSPLTSTTSIRSTTILESSSSASNNIDDSWTLVSTVAPNTKLSTIYRKPTLAPILEPTPTIDLDVKPMQGFGLEESTAKLDADVYQFIQLCNELAFGFWKSVTTGISTARSVIVSPFAATSLLAMVFLGARGATSGEMNEILKLDNMVTFNPHLIFKTVSESILTGPDFGVSTSAIVRQLYSDKGKEGILNFYKERAKFFYDGHVEEVSFKDVGDTIRRRTNLLVKKHTNGKIQEFLKDGSVRVRSPLAAVSASIMQTDCTKGSINDRDGEIHFVVFPSIKQRRLIPIPAVVYRKGFLAGYEPSLDATAVALGDKDDVVSFIFVLPGRQGINALGDGLSRLEKRLVESSFQKGAWGRLLRTLIPRPGLEVQIPRFSHRSIINATSALKQMGLRTLFDTTKADLRGLNGVAHDLHLSDMLQFNYFSVCANTADTHHSEYYPATSRRSLRKHRRLDHFEQRKILHDDPLYIIDYLSLPLNLRPRQARVPQVPRLRLDRPFLYFVRHNPTGLILHMGRFNPRLLP
ncbi:hypothetical protein HHI36_016412 [Cryptolaemus montrouzieri]|uniref:Serpin domain-containing protein n=1 Tax=Cryptolaemus montrouzieri TaxID=559131 RepID=A0ABD2NJS3_9CUCU